MKQPIPPNVTDYEVVFTGAEPPPNQVPIVNAGANINITAPTNSVQLNGSATDPDGVIAAYIWERLAGSGTISNPNIPNPIVNGLTAGTSIFRLTAVDSNGAGVSDDVSIIVNTATPPPTPGYALVFQTGFNKMSDITTDNGQYGNGIISTEHKTEGTGSFYSRPQNVSSGTRSEVQYTDSVRNPIEGAVEYDARYETIIPNNGCSLQWHPNTSGGSGSPFLGHENGKFVWSNWKAGANAKHPLTSEQTIQRDRWYKMRMEFKFGSNGYFRHYIDNKLVCEWTGQVGDGSGQYFKIGYNGWDQNSANSRIYYDNLRIYKKV